MTDLTLLHTAQVHCATFDALAPDAALTHVVRPDWLSRAQDGIDAPLRAEIEAAVAQADGPVLCTCTTIAEVATRVGATRIDWPMMQAAAQIGGPVLMAYCLRSTRAPSEMLLRNAFGSQDPDITLLDLSDHWPLFASGKAALFAEAIAASIAKVLSHQNFGCVVLAQASMAAAGDELQRRTDLPVLTSPELAVRAMLPDI